MRCCMVVVYILSSLHSPLNVLFGIMIIAYEDIETERAKERLHGIFFYRLFKSDIILRTLLQDIISFNLTSTMMPE